MLVVHFDFMLNFSLNILSSLPPSFPVPTSPILLYFSLTYFFCVKFLSGKRKGQCQNIILVVIKGKYIAGSLKPYDLHPFSASHYFSI